MSRPLRGQSREALFLLLCGPLALLACGKRGDPKAPLRHNPIPVTDLRVAQRGERVEVRFTVPKTSVDGLPLRLLDVDILRAQQDGDFAKVASRRRVKAAAGEVLVEDDPLPPPGTAVRVAVRTRAGSQESAPSAVVLLRARAPLAAPRELVVVAESDGAHLRWKGPLPVPDPVPTPAPSAQGPAVPNPAPSAPPPKPGFNLYRRPKSGAYAAPLTPAPLDGRSHTDALPGTGEEVCYVVRSLYSTEPLVESSPSDEACLSGPPPLPNPPEAPNP
jgi:hypothetical protein